MLSKVLTVMSIMFLSQLLWSCCRNVDDETYTYNIEFLDAKIQLLDISGFNSIEVSDSVYKEAFGLRVFMETEEKIAYNFSPKFGITSLMACSPPDDEFVYLDPIASIKLFVVDIELNKKSNVEKNFAVYRYDGELIPFDRYTKSLRFYSPRYLLEPIDSNLLPSIASFEFEVTLESGLVMLGKTPQIKLK